VKGRVRSEDHLSGRDRQRLLRSGELLAINWPAHYFIDVEGVSGTTISAKAIMRDPSGRSSSSSGRRQDQPIRWCCRSECFRCGAAADMKDVQSPETYIGYGRAENFVSPGAPFTTSLTFMWRNAPLNDGARGKMDDRRRACRPRPERRQYRLQVPRARSASGSRTGPTVSRSDSASRSTARHPHQPGTDVDADGQGIVTGSGFISSSGRAALSPITRSRSVSIPACRPTHLPSVT